MITLKDKKKFIEEIAPYVVEYSKKYERYCNSAVIAQACLESGYGKAKSTLGICKADFHNYFGMKYRDDGRVTCHCGTFVDGSREQNPDGSYRDIVDKWYAFDSMRTGVEGYFQFTNIKRYENLKYVSDPETYLANLKKDKYFTSLSYEKNVLAIIDDKDLNLRSYDVKAPSATQSKSKITKVNVHAGHNPDGKPASGASGFLKESVEDRKVKDYLIKYLKDAGITVYDCTCDDGKSHGVTSAQSDVLQKIVSKCNEHIVDLDISIHFNAGAKDSKGNGRTTGTEVLIKDPSLSSIATKIVNSISALGFTNRGVKTRTDLYYLNHAKSPALLIECCFVDDVDDYNLYNANLMAHAIATGILDQSISVTVPTKSTETEIIGSANDCPFIVSCLSNLNIRETPGGKVVYEGGCKKGTKYTIVAVQGAWGKLKSGRGWITLNSKYVKRG